MSSSIGTNGNGSGAAAGLSPRESTPGVVLQHRAFRAAFLALAYPGRYFELPRDQSARHNGTWPPAECAAFLLFQSVWEPDTTVCTLGEALFVPASVQMSSPDEAEIVIISSPSSHGRITRAFRGTEEAPEAAATALYVLSEQNSGTAVRLSGPGIQGSIETDLPLPRIELVDRNTACSQWPLGVDVLIVDESARILALPRTTRVEVLD